MDDLFGIITAGEGTLGESPVVFGLAQIGPRRGTRLGTFVIVMAWGVLRVDV